MTLYIVCIGYRGISSIERMERGGTDNSEFGVCGTRGPMGLWVLPYIYMVMHAYNISAKAFRDKEMPGAE